MYNPRCYMCFKHFFFLILLYNKIVVKKYNINVCRRLFSLTFGPYTRLNLLSPRAHKAISLCSLLYTSPKQRRETYKEEKKKTFSLYYHSD